MALLHQMAVGRGWNVALGGLNLSTLKDQNSRRFWSNLTRSCLNHLPEGRIYEYYKGFGLSETVGFKVWE